MAGTGCTAGAAAEGVPAGWEGAADGVVDRSIGRAPFCSYVRDPRLPMLPEAPLLRDPLEYPPEPPLAFANETAGDPMRENTMMVAMSVVVFKVSSFRRSENECMSRRHLNSNGFRK